MQVAARVPVLRPAGDRRLTTLTRHGLSATTVSSEEYERHIERLARKIVGDVRHPLIMEPARAAAEAELELAQIRRVKVTLIERIIAFGESKAPKSYIVRQRRQRPKAPTRDEKASLPEPKATTTSPRSETERAVEAMRWALPELLKLDRYERRAAIRRERALRAICGAGVS
jgi:hypothetical protein